MSFSRYIVAATIVGSAIASIPAAAQCSGTDSCSTTNTASVTIGTLVDLGMSSATTTLTAPAAADFAAGYVADVGPTMTVKANSDWTLSIKAAASNATNWTYTGTKGGVKAIGDLNWSVASGGTFAALTGSNTTVASSATSTNGTDVAMFFRTTYGASFAAVNNRPGIYSLPIVFTLSAP